MQQCCVIVEFVSVQVVACASTRYEYEVFTGDVVSVESEALVSQQSLLLAAARAANIWRKPPLAAVHRMVLRAPDGRARSLRFGTATADVPAQVRPKLLHALTSSTPCIVGGVPGHVPGGIRTRHG